MLPGRFNPQVAVLEYNANMAKLNNEELHGVLIAYEMRLDEEEGTSHLETVFAACKKTIRTNNLQRQRPAPAPASVKKRKMIKKVFRWRICLLYEKTTNW